MRLSQFKNSKVSRRVQFIDGQFKKVEIPNVLIGDISFYDIDMDLIESINDNVISKIENESDNYFLYKAIPYITDIECDISFEEFEKMLDKPSDEFIKLIEEIVVSVNEIFKTIEGMASLVKTSTDLASKNIVTEDKGNVNTINENNTEKDLNKDDLVDLLFEKLNATIDRTERERLIKQITELQK